MKFLYIFIFCSLSACIHKPIEDVTTSRSRSELLSFLTRSDFASEQRNNKKDTKEKPTTSSIDPMFKKLVSLHMDDAMDLKEVLKKIAKQARINLVLHKNVEGGVNYQAEKRPFLQVIDTICKMANLRYHIEENVLWIERDLPYQKTYNVQFLSLARSTNNQVSIDSNLFGKTASEQNLSNGSSSVISSKTTIDFWGELESSLSNMLQISSFDTTDQEEEILEEKIALTAERAITKNNKQQIIEKKKKTTSKKPSFAIHKQAGIISIFATERQHTSIQSFLDDLRTKTSTQILIEAKVVEVHLKEEYKSGIDWQRIGNFGLGAYTGAASNPFTGDVNASALFGSIAQKNSSIITNPETSQVISLGVRGPTLSAILNFMESFGVVRTLSSPRLTVLNNQTAILKVAENYIFFDITADRQFLNNNNTNYGTLVSTTSKPRSIPIGLVMAVHPSIDMDNDEIVLTLRPTISRLIATKEDPAVQLLNQSLNTPSSTLKSEFPVIAVREIDSVLRIKSGGVAILGGLMTEGAETGSAGVPGTADSPIDFMTTSKRRARAVSELVIFIRATILKEPTPDATDKRVYATFTTDPRPLLEQPKA